MTKTKTTKTLWAIIILVAVVLVGWVAVSGVTKNTADTAASGNQIPPGDQTTPQTEGYVPGDGPYNDYANDPSAAGRMTVQGKMVCLPHKDTTGPQTMECAFGMQADDGTYYGLRDESGNPARIASIPTGTRVEVTGILRSDDTSKYQDAGNIAVISIKQL